MNNNMKPEENKIPEVKGEIADDHAILFY